MATKKKTTKTEDKSEYDYEDEPAQPEKRTLTDESDIQVSGAGSPLCNGTYNCATAGALYNGSAGLTIQVVSDYPSPGDSSFAIVDGSSRIYYCAPNADTLSYPWDGIWQTGSFGADPPPQVAVAEQIQDTVPGYSGTIHEGQEPPPMPPDAPDGTVVSFIGITYPTLVYKGDGVTLDTSGTDEVP